MSLTASDGGWRTEQPPEPITAEWLASVGFKWHQFDRQPDMHWLLWLGHAIAAKDCLTGLQDVGIELAPQSHDGGWFCWFRSDMAGRYSRFIHVRTLTTQGEVAQIVEALSGWPWRPQDHFFGSCLSPDQAERERADRERLDRRLMRSGHPHNEIERDDTRGGALPEHMAAADKAVTPSTAPTGRSDGRRG